jgi:hypothetical protein
VGSAALRVGALTAMLCERTWRVGRTALDIGAIDQQLLLRQD